MSKSDLSAVAHPLCDGGGGGPRNPPDGLPPTANVPGLGAENAENSAGTWWALFLFVVILLPSV